MCTVTYLPTKTGFLLTSNRDEAFVRKPAENPQIVAMASASVLFPRDGDAGGTWIATAANNRTICLLNGAFFPHKHQPPYRKSRGLVVLDFFESASITAFAGDYNLNGIEPFTILVVERNKLYEMRWDGLTKFLTELDATHPHIRCSVTLYNLKVIALREKWFSAWLKAHKFFELKEILRFHLFAGENDAGTNVRMSRMDLVKTVSVTSIESKNEETKMYYSDLTGDNGFSFSGYGFDANKHYEKFTLNNPSI
jgi:hypothetical protein